MKITRNQLRSLIKEEMKQINEVNLRNLSKKINNVFIDPNVLDPDSLQVKKPYSSEGDAGGTARLQAAYNDWSSKEVKDPGDYRMSGRSALAKDISIKLKRIGDLLDAAEAKAAAEVNADVATAGIENYQDKKAAADVAIDGIDNYKDSKAAATAAATASATAAATAAAADAEAKAKEGVVTLAGDNKWEYKKNKNNKWFTRRKTASAGDSWYGIDKLDVDKAKLANDRLNKAFPVKQTEGAESTTLFESRLRKLAGL